MLNFRFVPENPNGQHLRVNREVNKTSFPKIQHLPTIVATGLIVQTTRKPFVARWDLRKAVWSEYSNYVDDNIYQTESIPDNYGEFDHLIKSSAKKSTPKCYGHNYTPCWTRNCEKSLQGYKSDENVVNANKLMVLPDEDRRKTWIQVNEQKWIQLTRVCKVGPSLGSYMQLKYHRKIAIFELL